MTQQAIIKTNFFLHLNGKENCKCEKNIHKNASLIIQKKIKVCVTNPKKYAPQFILLLHNNTHSLLPPPDPPNNNNEIWMKFFDTINVNFIRNYSKGMKKEWEGLLGDE